MKSQKSHRALFWPSAFAVTLLAGVLIASCDDPAGNAVTEGERLQVVATIAPAGALARAVAGEAADVSVLAGVGIDPHDFELSPDSRRDIDDANLVVRIGLGIDAFVDDVVPESRMVTLSDGLTLREASEGHHEDEDEQADSEADEHEEGEFDPHVWHDVENDKVMAETLAAAFAAADPANADAYRANAEALKERLDAADQEARSLIDSIPVENRKMVTDHDAFGYFIDRYGLTFVGAVIPSTTGSAEASAGQMAELVETIEREDVKAVFAESSVNPDVAKQLADEAHVKIVDDLYGDSLGEPGSGADTIEGMLVANARKISEALK